MAKKISAKQKYNNYKLRIGAMAISVGVVLAFILGAAGATGFSLLTSQARTAYKAVEIVGSDGLIGSYGYDQPFESADKIIYNVTYNNTSSEDRFLQIKATMRENDFSSQVESKTGFDMGDTTGSIYSEKKLVKAGTKEVFEFPIVEYTGVPTKFVELEAFKSKAD